MSSIFLIFVQFLFDLLIIVTRARKVFFVALQIVLNVHEKKHETNTEGKIQSQMNEKERNVHLSQRL